MLWPYAMRAAYLHEAACESMQHAESPIDLGIGRSLMNKHLEFEATVIQC